jgi:hypothetical protein
MKNKQTGLRGSKSQIVGTEEETGDGALIFLSLAGKKLEESEDRGDQMYLRRLFR